MSTSAPNHHHLLWHFRVVLKLTKRNIKSSLYRRKKSFFFDLVNREDAVLPKTSHLSPFFSPAVFRRPASNSLMRFSSSYRFSPPLLPLRCAAAGHGERTKQAGQKKKKALIDDRQKLGERTGLPLRHRRKKKKVCACWCEWVWKHSNLHAEVCQKSEASNKQIKTC